MSTAMTSQERVNRMFARRDQDRIPRHDTFWGETITRWSSEGLDGGRDQLMQMLQSDFASLQWLWPSCFPDQRKVLREDELTRDILDGHGKICRYWKNKAGTPEHLGFDCGSAEKWRKIYKPALLATGPQNDPAAVARSYRKARAEGKWCHLTGVEVFEETRSLMGDEITAIATIEDPEWVMDVAKTFTDQMIFNLDVLMSTGIQPDGLWIYGDMAYNHATFCSPAMYKELFWPQHKRLADWAHAHNQKFIYHTDGRVIDVMDLWVQAGFDCFQPIEAKAGMDIRQLCPKYGDRMAMFGNIDIMVMGSNDLDKIDHEIKTKFAAGMATRGYAYHSDHSVPPTVSWPTYQHVLKLIDRYGTYA